MEIELNLSADLTVEQGMQAILSHCLDQIRHNEAGVLAGDDPEFLHQMRVGVRRFRSAIRLFRRVASPPPDVLREIAWLGEKLGAARDWDVLLTATLPGLSAAAAVPLTELERLIRHEVAKRRTAAARTIRSARYRKLLLISSAWVQSAQWRNGADAARIVRLESPLIEFARRAISRGHRKILGSGASFHSLDASTLHRLRIAAKRSRYAAEFFRSLGNAKSMRRYIDALTTVQDALGQANDLATADRLMAELLKTSPQSAPAIAFSRGYWLAQSMAGARPRRKAWNRFLSRPLPVLP